MVSGGVFDQHRQATLAIRSLSHLSAAVQSSRGTSPTARTLMLAASLAGDVAMARRAVRTHRSRTFEIALNALDAAAWACVSDEDPLNTRTAVIATVVSCAMETGFRLGAGTEAVPV